MSFNGVLFKSHYILKDQKREGFIKDLHIDHIVDVVVGEDDYGIEQFFYSPLDSIEDIRYRQEIFKDLEGSRLFEHIKSFSNKMREMRNYLNRSKKSYYKYYKERMFLNAVEIYCYAIKQLSEALESCRIESEGFSSFKNYIEGYVATDGFIELFGDVNELENELLEIRYSLLIKENAITVSRYEDEVDLGYVIENMFKKFQKGAVKDYTVEFAELEGLNHVEAQILEKLAKLYPDIFLRLSNFYENNQEFEDSVIVKFNREIQFYIAYLDHIAKFRQRGLEFCYPDISLDKNIYVDSAFDLALADKLFEAGKLVVCNDFYLEEGERIFIVTGPNQGGKTTFARTFGQLHFLAKLGLPVPAKRARLFLFDRIFSHFEREEDITDLKGKLEDDLVRIKEILSNATPNSIVIFNEILSSTTFFDALFLSKEVMKKIIELDLICVWVTFIDELTKEGSKVVSMVASVVRDDPSIRTYKIVRRPSDGMSYAMSIAYKYRLTYKDIKKRIVS